MEKSDLILVIKKLLNEKYNLLKEVLYITNEQSKVISEEELDNLQGLVNKKQSVIDNIELVDKEFLEHFNNLKIILKINNISEISEREEPEIVNMKISVSDIMKVLQEISKIEEENDEKINELRKHILSELQKVNAGKHLNNVYAKKESKEPVSYFINKKG